MKKNEIRIAVLMRDKDKQDIAKLAKEENRSMSNLLLTSFRYYQRQKQGKV